MNLPPVILRELTAASRRRETWILRMVFGIGIGLAFVFGVLLDSNRGPAGLRSVVIASFVLGLLTGPYLTADAISFEKREGTLGLLFLTPLSGLQIVLGKMVTHSLQVSYALLATFPFLFLPLLLGGVTWSEVLRLVLVLLTTQLLSLGCGLLWSVFAEDARNASLGTALSLLLVVFVPMGWPFFQMLARGNSGGLTGVAQFSPMTWLISAFDSSFQRPGSSRFGVGSGAGLYWSSVGLGMILGLGLVLLAGLLLPRIWRRTALSRPALERTIPATQRSLRPPRRAVENLPPRTAEPLVWLAMRNLGESPPLRWFRWGLVTFFGVMLWTAVTTRHWQEGFLAACCSAYAIHLVMRLQAVWTATRWLYDERRSGALELLLTTPVPDSEILHAHHESLRRVFRRPLRTLLGVNATLQLAVLLFWNHLNMDNRAGAIFSTLFIGGAFVAVADLATLRWLSLREALRATTPARAAGRAFASLMVAGYVTLAIAVLFMAYGQNYREGPLIFILWFAVCLFLNQARISQCRHAFRDGLRAFVRPPESEPTPQAYPTVGSAALPGV